MNPTLSDVPPASYSSGLQVISDYKTPVSVLDTENLKKMCYPDQMQKIAKVFDSNGALSKIDPEEVAV